MPLSARNYANAPLVLGYFADKASTSALENGHVRFVHSLFSALNWPALSTKPLQTNLDATTLNNPLS